jgi:hypothetical protein
MTATELPATTPNSVTSRAPTDSPAPGKGSRKGSPET